MLFFYRNRRPVAEVEGESIAFEGVIFLFLWGFKGISFIFFPHYSQVFSRLKSIKPLNPKIAGVEGELFPAMTFGNDKFSAAIYPNSKQRLATQHWHVLSKPPMVIIHNYNLTASNVTHYGYPTVRADGQYRKGTFYIEVVIDFLSEGGFLMVRYCDLFFF